ncbi:hypothetical protein SAMN02745166_04451 [Prosthecobacter debontii]|uniref:Fibronectin type-III domain-containing protein n=1 Tax=Prosthecobacter debontii TaxID=48467 RepID=A0A1T4YX23_9BACT|nr:hypothetical protein [Prosthecobacter debontii]SKB06334.1 hypothetical protein SAMN02745166_04451 [Prosthecobacter debontii]
MKVVLCFLVLSFSWVLPWMASAQLPDDVGFISMVGTTTQVEGQSWAYLLWQSTEDSLAEGSRLALYRRDTPAGLFQRLAVTADQGDERTLQALIPRAVRLGQDVEALNSSLRRMFQDLVPSEEVSLAARLSAVIRGTRGDTERRTSLAFVARSHPLVAMALGQALPDRLPAPGSYTYELREFDSAVQEDIRVLGRVTVDTSAAIRLPAPGRPYVMLLPDARKQEGHLSVHLRWATPNSLRELALKHSGYRVYRVTRAYAENGARKWQNTPPSADTLLTAAHTVPDQVHQVNAAPIYPDQLMDEGVGATGAENPGDQTTYFFTDDNDRFDPGGEPLPNGAQYYYFVTALDILLRDGQVSPGRLTTICDRMRPPAPVQVRVVPEVNYVNGESIQQLLVRWAPVQDADSSVSAYHVYRWSSLEEMQEKGNQPEMNRVAIIPHDPEAREYRYLDAGHGAPRFPPLEGQPDISGTGFIYTVRALDSGACGANASPHSAPSRGVIRDPEGPAAPIGQVVIQCHQPVVEFTSASLKPETGLTENAYHLELVCVTPFQETFEWTEFRFGDGFTYVASPVGRVYFGDRGTESQIARLLLSREAWPNQIYCRAALRGGRTSDWVQATVSAPSKARDQRLQILFTASLNSTPAIAGGACGSTHLTTQPGTDDVSPICMSVMPAPSTRELKIYRQVDDGPLTLVSVQEVTPGTPVQWCDGELPVTPADNQYFVQGFDENGQPSELVRAGGEIHTGSSAALPVPMLLPPEHLANNKARLSWSCASYGVERFELWIAKKQGVPNTGWSGSLLSDNLALIRPTRNPSSPSQDFGVYQTGLVGGLATLQDGAVFYVDVPVQTLLTYHVLVRAVDRGRFGDRLAGGFSNMQVFQWNASEVNPGIQVPWPARDLPDAVAATTFHPRIRAVYLPKLITNGDWQGVGIRIGEYDYVGGNSTLIKVGNPGPTGLPQYALKDHIDPKTMLFRRVSAAANSEREDELLPCVLYRMQTSSAVSLLPISADTAQASPLMEVIAHTQETANADNVTQIHDPFINIQVSGIPGGIHGEIFWLDRNPVIAGASYTYMLVRYAKNGEIAEILTTNAVQIP